MKNMDTNGKRSISIKEDIVISGEWLENAIRICESVLSEEKNAYIEEKLSVLKSVLLNSTPLSKVCEVAVNKGLFIASPVSDINIAEKAKQDFLQSKFENRMKGDVIVCWWSGGVTSAVACWLAILLFGKENVRIVMIDTHNEHPDTYRFFLDCQKWYGLQIEIISNKQYTSIEQIWDKYNSLNVANGAICSSEAKREVRLKFMAANPGIRYQVFGFDIDEPKRAKALTLNYPDANPFYPLLALAYTKKKCIEILTDAGIEIPEMYKLGYVNNNCYKTGCVKGGIWYWKKIQKERPITFLKMAIRERRYTRETGKPVTCLRNQTKVRKGEPIFLISNPEYPQYQCLDDKDGREPEPVFECNGMCGTLDLNSN